MKPLLKITTKPMKIAIRVEKGRYVVNETAKEPIALKPSVTQVQQRRLVPIQNNDHLRISRVNESKRFDPSYPSLALSSSNDEMSNFSDFHREHIFESPLSSVAYIANDAKVSSFEPLTAANSRISMESNADVEFQSGSISFSVEQYNQIEFEYTGSPSYVPASKSPERGK